MQFKSNYLLKNTTTLQIGGPAKMFVEVYSVDELIKAIKYAKDNKLEYLVIGGGSNLLISDLGFNGLIIKNEIKGSKREGNKLIVQSGTVLQILVESAIMHGLSGLEKLTGIPGTVGGAVYGNAGAYGQTISDTISQVKAFNGQNIFILTKDQCQFNYRDSIFKKNGVIILEVIFTLDPFDPSFLTIDAREVLKKRLVKYPPGIKCPGSFFKNIVASTLPKEILEKIPPEKIVYGKLPAGSLLEEVGAKGDALDGIYIADYHANLFVNKGNGTAQTFYDLAKKYAIKVKEKFGISLEPEVQLINLPHLY